MRRAARTDGNQAELVAALRELGISVAITAQLGNGFPDIVVGHRLRNYLFEVKDPDKPPSARKLTPDELKFHDEWRGSIHVVETLEDCLTILEIPCTSKDPGPS